MSDEQIRARDNEVTKYVAAALDRASTAAIAVGIFGPGASIMGGMISAGAFDSHKFVATLLAGLYWVVIAYILHRKGKAVLKKGLR